MKILFLIDYKERYLHLEKQKKLINRDLTALVGSGTVWAVTKSHHCSDIRIIGHKGEKKAPDSPSTLQAEGAFYPSGTTTGGLVVMTPNSHCRKPRFGPWSGN